MKMSNIPLRVSCSQRASFQTLKERLSLPSLILSGCSHLLLTNLVVSPAWAASVPHLRPL